MNLHYDGTISITNTLDDELGRYFPKEDVTRDFTGRIVSRGHWILNYMIGDED